MSNAHAAQGYRKFRNNRKYLNKKKFSIALTIPACEHGFAMTEVRMTPEISTADKLLFLQHVSREPTETGCLLWNSNKGSDGYGRFRIGTKYWGAHRLAYLIGNGPFDSSLVIRHMCDNPQCCNPKHLIPGTHADNMRDKLVRGRPALRRMSGSYVSTSHAAKRLGVSSARIGQMCRSGALQGRQLYPGAWWQVILPENTPQNP